MMILQSTVCAMLQYLPQLRLVANMLHSDWHAVQSNQMISTLTVIQQPVKPCTQPGDLHVLLGTNIESTSTCTFLYILVC